MTDYWLYIRVFGPIAFLIVLIGAYLYSPLISIAPIILVLIGALIKDSLSQPVIATLRGLKPAVIDSWLRELNKSASELDALDRKLESLKLKRVETSGESLEEVKEMGCIVNRRQIILEHAKKLLGRISNNLDEYGEVSVSELAEQLQAVQERQRELLEAFTERPEDGDGS